MEGISKNIVINELLITYRLFTPKENLSDKVFIFLHGWGSESSVWNNICNDLSKLGFTCYSIDLPGFGKSQKPDSAKTFQIEDFANTLKLFIEKFSLKKIVLIGHSFGGAVSIKYASANASEIEKLVLVDNSGIRLKREKITLVALGAKIVKPIFAPSFMSPLRRKIYKLIGNEDYLDSGDMKKTYLNVIQEDLSPILKDVTTDTLIIWGDKDRDTPVWMAQKLNQEIKNSRLEIFKNAGHYSFLERPEEFKNLLLEFANESK